MGIKEEIIRNKVVLISRGIGGGRMKDMAKALYEGGARLLEITFNQSSPDAVKETGDAIASVCSLGLDGLHVGAGTVMTEEQLLAANDSGAEFILSPNVDTAIIRRTKELGLGSVPGAYTPTEIAEAWKAGADIVKLFPASIGGIAYLRAIRGPISHIPLMAVGGISEANIGEFLKNGCCSCGLGSNIVRKDLIEAGRYDELTALVRKLMEAAEV